MSNPKPPPPPDYDDNPEWTEEDFARARRDPVPDEVIRHFRMRGPQREPTKQAVSIRLTRGVVDYFKNGGPGWQSRIDEALRKVVEAELRGER